MQHNTLTTILLWSLGLLITAYLALLTIANPSPQLITTLSFEVSFMLFMFAARYLNGKRKSQKQKSLVLEILIDSYKPLNRMRSALKTGTIIVLSFILLIAFIDFCALGAAILGNNALAKITYKASPTYIVIPDCHPALSLEIYSGACIESGKFDKAHKFTNLLLEIRESIYGKQHWKYGGMLGNLAGLYYKEGKFTEAIMTYEQSIEVCRNSEGNKHLGSAFTRLGNCYRSIGNFKKAEDCYNTALSMRIEEYGKDSLRVAETKFELATLAKLMKKDKLFVDLKNQAENIVRSQKKEKTVDLAGLVTLLVVSSLVSFILFSKRGLLTTLAMKKLDSKIQSCGNSPCNEDIAILSELKA